MSKEKQTSSTKEVAVQKKSPKEVAVQKKSPVKKSDKPKLHKRFVAAIKAMISELKKVSWPKSKLVISSTGIVLSIVLIFLVLIGLFDAGLGALLKLLTETGVK